MKNLPNKEQYEALQKYASNHGRTWKMDLNLAWSNGHDCNELNGHLLRQVRNQFGPNWLVKFTLRTYRLEQIQIVADHYIIAAIWADAPEGTHPKPTKETQREAFRQCEKFVADCGPLFDEAMARFDDGYGRHPDAGSAEAAFGHDFWLTRQGHGTGFWDRLELKENDLGRKLSNLCQNKWVEYEAYRGWFHLYKEWTK